MPNNSSNCVHRGEKKINLILIQTVYKPKFDCLILSLKIYFEYFFFVFLQIETPNYKHQIFQFRNKNKTTKPTTSQVIIAMAKSNIPLLPIFDIPDSETKKILVQGLYMSNSKNFFPMIDKGSTYDLEVERFNLRKPIRPTSTGSLLPKLKKTFGTFKEIDPGKMFTSSKINILRESTNSLMINIENNISIKLCSLVAQIVSKLDIYLEKWKNKGKNNRKLPKKMLSKKDVIVIQQENEKEKQKFEDILFQKISQVKKIGKLGLWINSFVTSRKFCRHIMTRIEEENCHEEKQSPVDSEKSNKGPQLKSLNSKICLDNSLYFTEPNSIARVFEFIEKYYSFLDLEEFLCSVVESVNQIRMQVEEYVNEFTDKKKISNIDSLKTILIKCLQILYLKSNFNVDIDLKPFKNMTKKDVQSISTQLIKNLQIAAREKLEFQLLDLQLAKLFFYLYYSIDNKEKAFIILKKAFECNINAVDTFFSLTATHFFYDPDKFLHKSDQSSFFSSFQVNDRLYEVVHQLTDLETREKFIVAFILRLQSFMTAKDLQDILMYLGKVASSLQKYVLSERFYDNLLNCYEKIELPKILKIFENSKKQSHYRLNLEHNRKVMHINNKVIKNLIALEKFEKCLVYVISNLLIHNASMMLINDTDPNKYPKKNSNDIIMKNLKNYAENLEEKKLFQKMWREFNEEFQKTVNFEKDLNLKLNASNSENNKELFKIFKTGIEAMKENSNQNKYNRSFLPFEQIKKTLLSKYKTDSPFFINQYTGEYQGVIQKTDEIIALEQYFISHTSKKQEAHNHLLFKQESAVESLSNNFYLIFYDDFIKDNNVKFLEIFLNFIVFNLEQNRLIQVSQGADKYIGDLKVSNLKKKSETPETFVLNRISCANSYQKKKIEQQLSELKMIYREVLKKRKTRYRLDDLNSTKKTGKNSHDRVKNFSNEPRLISQASVKNRASRAFLKKNKNYKPSTFYYQSVQIEKSIINRYGLIVMNDISHKNQFPLKRSNSLRENYQLDTFLPIKNSVFDSLESRFEFQRFNLITDSVTALQKLTFRMPLFYNKLCSIDIVLDETKIEIIVSAKNQVVNNLVMHLDSNVEEFEHLYLSTQLFTQGKFFSIFPVVHAKLVETIFDGFKSDSNVNNINIEKLRTYLGLILGIRLPIFYSELRSNSYEFSAMLKEHFEVSKIDCKSMQSILDITRWILLLLKHLYYKKVSGIVQRTEVRMNTLKRNPVLLKNFVKFFYIKKMTIPKNEYYKNFNEESLILLIKKLKYQLYFHYFFNNKMNVHFSGAKFALVGLNKNIEILVASYLIRNIDDYGYVINFSCEYALPFMEKFISQIKKVTSLIRKAGKQKIAQKESIYFFLVLYFLDTMVTFNIDMQKKTFRSRAGEQIRSRRPSLTDINVPQSPIGQTRDIGKSRVNFVGREIQSPKSPHSSRVQQKGHFKGI